MKNYCVATLLVCLLGCVLLSISAQALEMAKVTIIVVDEEGKAIKDAKVVIAFDDDNGKEIPIKGSTDENGFFSGSASVSGHMGGHVTKNGFYKSYFTHNFYIKKLGVWQPWNKEITVMLRHKLNPVPMYVKNRVIEIPEVGKEIGFDLMKFDWVIPYGQGTQVDFIFRIDRNYTNVDNFDVTMTLTFSNKYDGIQLIKDDRGGIYSEGSVYRLPRNAPEMGYQKKLVKRITRGNGEFNNDKAQDNNYIFRIRSEVNEDGTLKRSMYGKIRGDILLSPRTSKTSKIDMYYYLNPDYTRNLEFNPDRNLFNPISKSEYPIGYP